MDELTQRHRDVARNCTVGVFRDVPPLPAESLAALARAADEFGIHGWDVYGDHGAVARVESEVAELLGKPAAVFGVSGIMLQQAVLRVWCERMGARRVGLPALSHLLVHEEDGPRLLHDFRFEHLSEGRALPTVADLNRLGEGLAAVLLELPLRDAGCLLPTWEELTSFAEASHELGVPLHFDGARIWEAQPFYDRPLAEIAELADSVYVSFYKGLGGMAGACVATDDDVAEEVRLWRRRMGGTLYHLTPYAVGALVGLRDRLPRMADYIAWTRAVAVELESRGLRVHPVPPHTNTFQVFASGTAAQINQRLITSMERTGVLLSGLWQPADDPGSAQCELVVAEDALKHDPAVAAQWLAELL